MRIHQATHIFTSLVICLLLINSYAWSKDRLAVLEITGQSELTPDQRMHLSDQVRAEATRLIGNAYQILTRETMSGLTDTPEMLEAVETGREVDVGKALRAQWLITGEALGDAHLLRVTLKLHDIERGVSIDIEFAQGREMSRLVREVKKASGRLLVHLLSDKGQGELADIDLPLTELPESFELSPSDTLGLPLPLLKQYDAALVIDESMTASIEDKVEVWSKLSRYRKYRKLRKEARRRLVYWQQRFKRRVQCNRTWNQLEQILELKRAITDDKKEELVESFLDACGRTAHENPNLNAPYFARKRRAAEEREAAIEAKRAEAEYERRRAEEREAAEEAAEEAKDERESAELSLKNKKEYSFLETHIGGGYQLEAGSLSSYHLRVRLQPHSWWARRAFIDVETSFTRVSDLTQAEATWSGEWSSAVGLQALNNTGWAPSLSAGYQNRSGEHRLVGEFALRYRYIPDWLNLHLSLQYLRLISPEQPRQLPRGRLPRTFILDGTPDEMRLTLWASTGTLGLSLILLTIYGLSYL